MAKCPKPTQDIELNIKNRQKAIDKIGYGPLNPNEPNKEFWQKKADMWDVSIDEARKQKCSNCAGFNRSEEMLDCISKGMGDEDDSWDAIEAGQLGYCEPLDFKCAASRTCDAWIDRKAKSSGAKVSKVDIYLKTVDELLSTIEKKADRITEGSFVEWNSSGGKARGRVEHVMKSGTLGVPDSKFSINAEPGNPAVLIRIWKKNSEGTWDETDTLVGHKMSTLNRVDSLDSKDARFGEMEEKATRKVRDAGYWGRPVGTPITPGMKPTGPKSPAGRARSMGASGSKPSTSKPSRASAAKPKKRVVVPKPGGSGGGSKKPPKKPTPAASGGDKPKTPKAVSDAKKKWESDATASDLAAARQLEKEGWKWQEDSENSGTYGLSKDGKDFAITVTPGSDRYGMDEDVIAKAYERSKGDKPIPEASTFDYDKLTAREQREYRALTRAQRAEYEERWNARSADSTQRAKERRESAKLPDGESERQSNSRLIRKPGWFRPMATSNQEIAIGDGGTNFADNLETAYFGTGGKGPAGGTHSASILHNGDGTFSANFTRLSTTHGGESGGRAQIRNDFASREEAEAWVNERAKAAKVSINEDSEADFFSRPGGNKPTKKPLPKVRRPKKRTERTAKISVSDAIGDSNFEKVFNEDTEKEQYAPIPADQYDKKEIIKELKKISRDGRPEGAGTVEDPKDVGKDTKLARELLAEGYHIRMDSHLELATLVDELAAIGKEAQEKGEKAPDYDLCKVSVPETNLFCQESKGVPRNEMPQFKGVPMPGSLAEKMYNAKRAEVQARIDAGETGPDGKPLKLPDEADIEGMFMDFLADMGIPIEEKRVPSSNLKATQDQLVGTQVAGMAKAIKDGSMPKKVMESPVFVTEDGYVLDGHHRWAALVAIDMEDGKQGDVDMPVRMIGADIGYILDLANAFCDMTGVKRKSGGKKKPSGTTTSETKPGEGGGAGGAGEAADGALGLLGEAQERGKVK